jgi:aconitate hydratase
MAVIETTGSMVNSVYSRITKTLPVIRKRLGRPLTLTEKIFYGHLADPEHQDLTRGESFLLLNPDRVAMQDATAQMAILQFMLSGRDESSVPATVHCDHLIIGRTGVKDDLPAALNENREVFDFLSSASSRYHIGFWKPGAGIIHQIILENYAFPGGLMIGTDSHTPNAGGLGMAACGVGGADAADVMAGLPWEVKNPEIVGVRLTGKMDGWTSGKDVIIKLLEILTVSGGTNRVIEYFGPGCESISCTGKATITNMGAELGATCSVFPFDRRMGLYLNKTGRSELADLAERNSMLLKADEEVLGNPEKYFDKVIEINLSELEPQITGPHSPDAVTSLSKVPSKAVESGWPTKLSAALIGSCTNSSYEDMERSASLIRQALKAGLKFPVTYYVTPGSAQVKATMERDGIMDVMISAGSTILANACGPCIGQWDRKDIKPGEKNTIINSFNRNFRSRNDGNPETLSFIASPEIVTALAMAGKLDFDPRKDGITTPGGTVFRFTPPAGDEVPRDGYETATDAYQPPAGSLVKVIVNPDSDRLQLLAPFQPWNGQEIEDCLILCKAKGKCTTDHISPAGKWLRYRGHLENISENLLGGAVNHFTGQTGKGTNILTGETDLTFAQIARNYKGNNMKWVIIGDDNYGEGSSREHAAMSPRFLGGSAVITRSFARIHETNLKKQGILALTFADPADYDKIGPNDRLSIKGLKDFAPGVPLSLILSHDKGSSETIRLNHTYNEEQIGWFKAGSALNVLRKNHS